MSAKKAIFISVFAALLYTIPLLGIHLLGAKVERLEGYINNIESNQLVLDNYCSALSKIQNAIIVANDQLSELFLQHLLEHTTNKDVRDRACEN